MSKKHPVIAVTGSSGAGTTTVKRAFEHIFFREKINAAVIEGDSFHSLSRVDFKEAVKKAEAEGNKSFSHFGPQSNHFDKLAELFETYGKTGSGKKRYYIHSDEEAAEHNKRLNTSLNPGEFTPWEDVPAGSDVLFYEGLHGLVKTDDVDVSKHVDLGIGVVPIVNLEWIQKIHRDCAERGYSADVIVDTILRRMPDYVNYITPQFSRTDINFQRVLHRRHLQPLHHARHPDAGRKLHRDPLPRTQGRRFPLPAEHDPELLHVAPQHHRGAGRQDGLRHGTDPGADHPGHDREQEQVIKICLNKKRSLRAPFFFGVCPTQCCRSVPQRFKGRYPSRTVARRAYSRTAGRPKRTAGAGHRRYREVPLRSTLRLVIGRLCGEVATNGVRHDYSLVANLGDKNWLKTRMESRPNVAQVTDF